MESLPLGLRHIWAESVNHASPTTHDHIHSVCVYCACHDVCMHNIMHVVLPHVQSIHTMVTCTVWCGGIQHNVMHARSIQMSMAIQKICINKSITGSK